MKKIIEGIKKLHITTNHTGKMLGINSISTSCKLNKRCANNAKVKGSICEKCYAQRLVAFRESLRDHLDNNFELLTKCVIPEEDLPVINANYFRIEAFGDLANTTQAINYLNLIRKNPHTFFAWWTKNPDFIEKAFKKTGYEKPANCNILQSALMINKPIKKRYWFIDKIFTVFNKKYIKENGIEINCGARSCLKCHKCYEKNDIVYINEQQK